MYENLTDRQRLERILAVVRKYLPPDGISMSEALSEIIPYVDPFPQVPDAEPVAWLKTVYAGTLPVLQVDYMRPVRKDSFPVFTEHPPRPEPADIRPVQMNDRGKASDAPIDAYIIKQQATAIEIHCRNNAELGLEVLRLSSELTALQADAERYRFLKRNGITVYYHHGTTSKRQVPCGDMDHAIDSTMGEQK